MLTFRLLEEYSPQGVLFAKLALFHSNPQGTTAVCVYTVAVELNIIYPKIYRYVFCAGNVYCFVEINDVSVVPRIGIPPHISLLAEFFCVRILWEQ